MSNTGNHSFLREVLSTMGNAIAAAAAVHRGGKPAQRHLLALGIDAAEYKRIKRYY